MSDRDALTILSERVLDLDDAVMELQEKLAKALDDRDYWRDKAEGMERRARADYYDRGGVGEFNA